VLPRAIYNPTPRRYVSPSRIAATATSAGWRERPLMGNLCSKREPPELARSRRVEGNDDLTLAARSNRVTTLQLHHRGTDNRLAECDHRGNVSSFRASWRRAARPPYVDHCSLL